MVHAKPAIVELDMDKLEEILRRLEAKELVPGDYATIHTVIGAYVDLVHTVGAKDTTIRRLRQMLFGVKTEKTEAVLGGPKEAEPGAASQKAAEESKPSEEIAADVEPRDASPASGETPQRAPGHGRHGANAYTGAERIEVPHPSLASGDPCPQCEAGTVYDTRRPGVLVRLTGQPPVGAKVYSLQKLRCNLCGVVFTATVPVEAGEAKYDATVGSMIALLKYGSGMPFHREERLQAGLGVPLAASTQWELVEAQAEHAEPVFAELLHQAAQGDVFHNDDTGVKILEMMGRRARPAALAEEPSADAAAQACPSGEDPKETSSNDSVEGATAQPEGKRRALCTSGIVATKGGQKIALFLSGRRHAGENLKEVLARRGMKLPPPIQMCDALSRNLPGELKTILANCLAHGRRRFVEVTPRFPEECRHVLESLGAVYRNDAQAREGNLSPEERLRLHQTQSGPVMKELQEWLVRQIDERRVEPNSSLGQAIAYLLRHWEPLTLFLRVPGAPLDNNICERALKRAILHRKNALFYKTCHGAAVGDLFMSLIGTCELCGENPFEYLVALERHAERTRVDPPQWMPWNYRQTLLGLSALAPDSSRPVSGPA